MGAESSAHHGESITPAPQPQPQQYSSQETIGSQKPADIGVDTALPRITLRAICMGLFVSMGGLLFGYDTGQISGFQEMSDYLERFGELGDDGYAFSNVRSGLIVGLLSIGTLIGALCGAPIADKLGRKWSITMWCIILIIGIVVQISSPSGNWVQIVMGRWTTGLGVGGCSLVVPMYQGESAPKNIRGAMISSYQLFVTLGIFLAYVINLGTESLEGSAQWRITLGITFVFALVLGIGMAMFPESPRFDYRHGRIDTARQTMARLYGAPENHRVIIQELAEIQAQLDSESEQEQKWNEFFTAPRMAHRIVLGIALQALQQLTGANYFFYFGTTIFNGAGISNSFITQVILGAVNFGTTFGGLYVVENFGRRKSLIIGALCMFVLFMIFASIGHFVLDVQHPENTPAAGKGMIVVTCVFIMFYATTWGPIVWSIVAELFPSKYRAKGMALATASNWLWNFLLSFFTSFITDSIDFAYGYVFAGCLLVATLVVYFFVIEGKDRTLEEIDYMYVNKVKPWKSSDFEMPNFHSYTYNDEGARKESKSYHAEKV
ncbi:general substrate transporter [Aspergillus cavernicola]|uniref:General substrate transporter n=1 Tax=Aspergillus cavernicola TaxID=176166 RepID=A0ABR4I6S2_9EURO